LQADIFNQPVYIAKTNQATGYGAAILAGIGIGLFDAPPNIPFLAVQTKESPVYPRKEYVTKYQRAYETYTRIYPNITSI
jgi:sugar (pentulose or hexulose) kinase